MNHIYLSIYLSIYLYIIYIYIYIRNRGQFNQDKYNIQIKNI